MNRTTAAGVVVAGFVVVAVANVASVALGAATAANVTQWLLMPVLVVVFLVLPPRGASPLPRLRTATLAALGFSWLGDVLPDVVPQSAAFLSMVGAFLCAQVAFIVGFLPDWRRSIVRHAPWALACYVAACLALIAACARGAGSLLIPVVVYGLTITAMAVLATGLNELTALGGVLFMASDAFIALAAFRGWQSQELSVAIMATYAAAELLLVLGIQRHRAAQTADADYGRSVASS